MAGPIHINDEIKLHHLGPMESPEDLYTYYIHKDSPNSGTMRLAHGPHFNGEKNETLRVNCLFQGHGTSKWQKLD